MFRVNENKQTNTKKLAQDSFVIKLVKAENACKIAGMQEFFTFVCFGTALWVVGIFYDTSYESLWYVNLSLIIAGACFTCIGIAIAPKHILL